MAFIQAPTPTVPQQADLLGGWHISGWPCYILYAALTALLVRVVVAFFKGLESGGANKFWEHFKGFSADKKMADYWGPFAIGWLEALAYPVLMRTHNWAFVGAWLGFKTVAQWRGWAKDRSSFNRFLIGNALVLIVSLLFLTRFVLVAP